MHWALRAQTLLFFFFPLGCLSPLVLLWITRAGWDFPRNAFEAGKSARSIYIDAPPERSCRFASALVAPSYLYALLTFASHARLVPNELPAGTQALKGCRFFWKGRKKMRLFPACLIQTLSRALQVALLCFVCATLDSFPKLQHRNHIAQNLYSFVQL